MVHVLCKSCGDWEIVGPGHASVRVNPATGQHELHDRSALLKNCSCPPDDLSGSRPLAFTFMAATGA